MGSEPGNFPLFSFFFIMNNKMKQKYFYEIGKIYFYNLKKIFEDNLVVGLTASKKKFKN